MKVSSSILADAQRRAEGATREPRLRAGLVERLLSRPNGLWPLSRLGDALGIKPEQADTELSAILVDAVHGRLGTLDSAIGRAVLRRHVNGWSCGTRGVYEHLRVPSAYEIERWVHHEDYATLDAALAATQTEVPRAIGEVPRLRWRTGTRLSTGAQAWYLSQLLSGNFVLQSGERDASKAVRGAAGLIESALHEGDTVVLAQWVLVAKLPASCRARIPRTTAALDWIGGQVEAGELPRSRALGLMGSDRVQSRRWAFRWGELRSPRYPDAISDERIEGLWPVEDDATGDLDRWSNSVAQVLRRAMIEQRAWRLDDFREAYLEHPLAAPIAESLVYVMGGLPVVFVGGRAHGIEGPLELELGGELRVAHAAEGIQDWPQTGVAGAFRQREHPVLGAADLPRPPTEPVPHSAWKRRVRTLRLLSDVESGGGTVAELWLLGTHRVHIDHAGYGTGYGGARPIERIEVSVRVGGQPPLARLSATDFSGWDTLPPWLLSEVARMLRVLFGLDSVPTPSRAP
ncbi:MAG: DUF4132 domain-containing protein [Myxococcota bacterium]